jgi:hypothetical protein
MQRLGETLELILIGEERSQLRCNVRVPSDESLPIRRLTGFCRLKVSGDRFIDSFFSTGRIRFGVHDSLPIVLKLSSQILEPAFEQAGDRCGATTQVLSDLSQ